MEESNHDSFLSYVNQSLMIASYGSFGIKSPEGLQPKGIQSILHPVLELMGCCILHDNDLDFFVEGHPPNSLKDGLTDEIICFYTFWMQVFR